jgi:hypothetical protein
VNAVALALWLAAMSVSCRGLICVLQGRWAVPRVRLPAFSATAQQLSPPTMSGAHVQEVANTRRRNESHACERVTLHFTHRSHMELPMIAGGE